MFHYSQTTMNSDYTVVSNLTGITLSLRLPSSNNVQRLKKRQRRLASVAETTRVVIGKYLSHNEG